jgi:hypothetical protein
MYSRGRQKLIDKVSALGGVPHRQLIQGAGAAGLAALLRPTAVFGEPDDDDERASRTAREEAHNICHQHRFGGRG